MTRLRVLFLTSWYPTADQPVSGVFVREHAKAVSLYDDVTVAHLVGYDPGVRGLWKIERETDQGLTEGIPTYRVRHGRPAPRTSLVLYLLSAWATYLRVRKDGFVPDVIHAHVFSAGLPAVLLRPLHRLPVVVSEHFTGFPRRSLSKRDARLARFALRHARRVLPVSRHLQESIERYGIHPQFTVVPNVVDTRLFHPSDRKDHDRDVKRLMFVGLMAGDHRKGVPVLFEALSELKKARSDWRLELVGDGVARVEYEHLAAALGLSDHVTFHGILPKARVAQLMRESNLLVVASHSETFSVVAAEALATGVAVVATRCGGPEDLITPDCGVLVPLGDARALCAGLNQVIDWSPAGTKRCAERARATFGPEAVGSQLHDIYGAVIGRQLSEFPSASAASSSWKETLRRRLPRTFEFYRRARGRWSLWGAIRHRLHGVHLKDRLALAASAVVDTFDCAFFDRSWAPCTWLPCTVVDPRYRMKAAPRRGTDDVYFLLPRREDDAEEAILSPLRPGDTFVDCGANVGYYTLRGAKIVGANGLVVSIEPVSATAARLRSNISLNGFNNVRIIEAAAGRTACATAPMQAPTRIHGMASLKPVDRVAFRVPVRAIGSVAVRSLDDLCADRPHVRVLKLDIEGSELDALQGAEALLQRTDTVVCERNRDGEAIANLLAGAGFRVEALRFTTYLRASRLSDS